MKHLELSKAMRRGSVSWMARNPVAANLAVALLMIGGLYFASKTKQEVFPEFDLDVITVQVIYPGAGPEEVEKGIVLAVEEAVRGVDGVKKVTSTAAEGRGYVVVEVMLGEDTNAVLADVKNAVDRIQSFPRDSEKPIVSAMVNRRDVISVMLYGDQSEKVLRELAERVRDDLLQDESITQVELFGVKPLEISVEVPQAALRTYQLTLDRIAALIGQTALELPGGAVKTSSGEVLLRMDERLDEGHEFAQVAVVTSPDGGVIRLGDIAEVRDGFSEVDQFAEFNGKPAVMIKVYRVGEQTPIQVADAVKAYVAKAKPDLPPGVNLATWADDSDTYRQRIDLLVRNATSGLILVLLCLGLFLEIRLAFWVTMGIPISILGSFIFLPSWDVSINMVSLFGFIITLGMVVDDAIVIGENIYERSQRGMPMLKSAIIGAREVAGPVVFSILTTVATFAPLLFVPGVTGKIFRNIPAVVITVLLISLLESIFVLPAHLGHLKPVPDRGIYSWIHRFQQLFGKALEWAIVRLYGPVLAFGLRHRYFTTAVGTATLIASIGYVAGGHIAFTFFPRVEADVVTANIKMPFGAPVEDTVAVQQEIRAAAQEILGELGGEDVYLGVYSQVGSPIAGRGPGGGGIAGSGGHLAGVQVQLVPADKRKFMASQFVNKWRDRVGNIAGVDSLTFTFTTGPSGGSPIDVQLVHSDVQVLERAASELAEALGTFAGVKDIDAGFSSGKPQLDFHIQPEGRALGLTAQDVARQVRASYAGAEALRQQRGRNELRVYVRLPEEDRRKLSSVEDFVLRTPTGGEIPLEEATRIDRGRAYTEIKRSEGQRVLNVTADLVEGVTTADRVTGALRESVLPRLSDRFPGLSAGFEGEQRERNDALSGLGGGFMIALLVMYALLAIPFKNYVQPLIIMSAIPFGLVGALGGHILMGFDFSVMSIMGIVALSGVVVNDSIVLIDAANVFRAEGASHFDAIHRAGVRRFRPILLTSITTFFGLMPMIFETSVQARFLIPMALSLGFGILASTFTVMAIVPSLYLVVEDIRMILGVPSPIPDPPEPEDEDDPVTAPKAAGAAV